MKALSAKSMRPEPRTFTAGLNDPNPAREPESMAIRELSISGYWMLVAFGAGVIAMQPILWVVIRRWLFAP